MILPYWLRSSVAGLAGGIAWYVGLSIIFGAAQSILSNPNWQSQKLLLAFRDARTIENPMFLPIGLLSIGLVWGGVYGTLARAWAVVWWQRGLRFAALSWALMVPWFEFYLPWNVLKEPTTLVLLEMICWAGVLLLVGLTIAGTEQVLAGVGSRSIKSN